MARFHAEILNEQHSISDFHCGDEEDALEIAAYLRHDALLDGQKGVARTFVLLDLEKPVAGKPVAGFFTLRACSAKVHERFFEKYEDYHEETALDDMEVPLVELMYLARDKAWERQGVGDILVTEALLRVAQASECIGFIGLQLRSTEQGRHLYERYPFQLFRTHSLFDGARYVMPLLDIRLIADAVKLIGAVATKEETP